MAHVFISYVRDDSDAVDSLCASLKAKGINVWLDRESIKPGARWKDAIRGAIQDGEFFIACFSKNSLVRGKTYMNEELTVAIEELRKYSAKTTWFIPVALDECNIPAVSIGAGVTLADLQLVRIHPNQEEAVRRICEVIQPTDPREARWKEILRLHFLRDIKARCSTCGDRYALDNLYICASCGASYCIKCIRDFPKSDSGRWFFSQSWKCRCGGDTWEMTDAEWVDGYEIWREKDESDAKGER